MSNNDTLIVSEPRACRWGCGAQIRLVTRGSDGRTVAVVVDRSDIETSTVLVRHECRTPEERAWSREQERGWNLARRAQRGESGDDAR